MNGPSRYRWGSMILFVFICFLFPSMTFAHVTLLQANPPQGSHLDHAPKEITLHFSERLGGDLYHLTVYNRDGEKVTRHKANLGQKHRELSLRLPALDAGIYTVTYKVISADGHSVSDSYTFSVGKVDQNALTKADENANRGSHDHSLGTFLVRIAYYLSLLLLTGWTFWGMVSKREPAAETTYRQGHQWLKRIYFFFLLGFGFIEFSQIFPELGPNKIVSLFTSSAVGLCWLISLFLVVMAFFYVGRWKGVDGIWIMSLLGAEAFNGHTFAFHPVFLTVFFDFVHLAAAAVWAGGLLILVSMWKRHPGYTKRFLLLFSRTALWSIVVLMITGVMNTLLFLPHLSDIFYTVWGKLLLFKTLLVLAIIVIAGLIRLKIKKGSRGLWHTVKADFSLMIAIFIIVGVFTYLNPVPVNQPLVWKAKKNQMTVTTSITPKAPAISNTFSVRVNVSEEPHHVRVVLTDESHQKIEPIQIHLTKVSRNQNHAFTYKKQQNIPFPGKWEIKVYVLDAQDHVTVVKKEVRIFSLES